MSAKHAKPRIGLNERKTEDLVESALRKLGYFQSGSGLHIEKQKSDTPRVNKLLATASKQGAGAGRPEFIIQSDKYPDFLLVIECKASTKFHQSSTLDKYGEYAVDGVLLYASFLSKEFDVLAIAVSGEDAATLRVSHFLHLRGDRTATPFRVGKPFVSFDDFHDAVMHSEAKFRQDYSSLLDYTRALNNLLQARKMLEAQRAFLISAILIGLQNKAFAQSYTSHKTGKNMAVALVQTIEAEFEAAQLPSDRRKSLVQAFSFIPDSPPLVEDKEFFVDLIRGIDDNVNSFMRTYKYYDTIGQFYVEFLRYANNDKGLGIVLTPPHIAELFAELAEDNRNSVVLDNCCGTAGLLIACMDAMIRDVGADKGAQAKVKNSQLIGVEFQPPVYALAVSNMILHGDGKTNIFRGDCFADLATAVGHRKPTVGVLNPPYKNKTVETDREELAFVINNLGALQQDGKCVAIVPITCATAPSGAIAELKKNLLEHHTLEAVLSMPVELFHNSKTTVVTCVMVFTAHRPHPKNKKTWFGYCRDDGFVKTKHRGRIDTKGTWPEIRDLWIDSFRNRDIVSGFSVAATVRAEDEWCAEAYLETNYNLIDKNVVAAAAKSYLLTNAMLRNAFRKGAVDGEV